MKANILSLFCLLLSISSLIAQNQEQEFDPIVANSKRLYDVHLFNGDIIRCNIQSVETGRSITVLNNDNSRQTYAWEEVQAVREVPLARKASIGIGLGVPYGILGINGEYFFLRNLSLSAGIGTSIFAGPGYSAGLRLYLRSPENTWQPKVSAHYGTNGLIATGGFSQTYRGLTLGLGQIFMFGPRKTDGIDATLTYLATSGVFAHPEAPSGRVRISIGYRHAFR